MSEKITREEWLDNLCRNHMITNTRDLSIEQLEKWIFEYKKAMGSECSMESFKRALRKSKNNYLKECGMLEDEDIKEPEIDPEILEANVRFKKEKQKFMDTSRIERKTFREYVRIENAVSEYGRELVKLLQKHGSHLSKYTSLPTFSVDDGEVGLIQISDTHLNELIDLPHNKYDFKVASHRLFKLYKESSRMFKARGITKIVVAFTGDLLNSDRRLDELLNQASNRSKATFMAVDLFKEFLYALTQNFKVHVVSVLGNESRVNKEMPFSEEGLSDSYDFMITNMLKVLFEASGNKNIEFGSLSEVETIIEINNHKVLLSHDIPKSTSTAKGTQSVVGMKYLQGQPIDCFLSGHIHSTNNQEFGYRSASLCGANSYSDNALHLASRAGQNIYFFGKGYRHAMSIDLQEYTEGEWFDIDYSLMGYHAKSLDKTKKHETIMSIII